MESEKWDKKSFDPVENHLQLIDFSSEDDFLVDHPFRDSLQDFRLSVAFEKVNEHDSFKLFNVVNPLEVKNAEKNMHQTEQKLSSSESLEPRRASYLRQSLAWDNAFFTSAGVLNTEELSVVNSGFKKPESYLFPGIQELKARRSADSDSTYYSDALSLESFEGDPFEDVRASIHRSCGTSNLTAASCESNRGKAASKEINVSSQNKIRSTPVSRRHISNHQRLKTTNQSSLPPQISQDNDINVEYKSSPNSKLSMLGTAKATSVGQTKRASSGNTNIKSRTTKIGYGEGLKVPKQSGLEDSHCLTNICTPPFKSSSSLSHSATKCSSLASSLSDKSVDTSSSRSTSGARNIGSSNSKMASSGSSSKPPIRHSGRSRSRLSNPTSLSPLLSMSNPSFNKSPSSSIDGWSSESSSTSTSTAKPRSDNFETSLRCSSQASDSHDASLDFETNRIKSFPNQCMGKAVRDPGSDPVELSRNSKLSGLRMPSPKIGFFDEEKSPVPMVRDSLQFQFEAQNALPNAIKRRPSKLQQSRNSLATGNKHGSHPSQAPHFTSSTTPQHLVQSPKLGNAPKKLSGMRNSVQPTPKVQTAKFLEVDNVYCSKTRKVGNGENDRKKVGLTSSLKTEGKRTKGILKNKMGKEGEDEKSINGIPRDSTNPIKGEHEHTGQLHVESNLHSNREKKENLSNFEDQVDGLSRYFEVIDLGGDVMIELEGKTSNVSDRVVSFKGEKLLCSQQQDSPQILEPCLLALPTAVDLTPNTRTPLADKNSLFKESGPIELITEKIDKGSTFPSLASAQKENN